MNVTGTINLFVKDYEGKDGKKFKLFSGSLGKKNEDGTYSNARLNVRFSKKFPKLDALDKLEESRMYQLEVTDGFLSFDNYEEDGKAKARFAVVINDASVKTSNPIKAAPKKSAKKQAIADSDIPF